MVFAHRLPVPGPRKNYHPAALPVGPRCRGRHHDEMADSGLDRRIHEVDHAAVIDVLRPVAANQGPRPDGADQVVNVLHGRKHRVAVAHVQFPPRPLFAMLSHGALAVGGRRAHRVALFMQQPHRRTAGAPGGAGNQDQFRGGQGAAHYKSHSHDTDEFPNFHDAVSCQSRAIRQAARLSTSPLRARRPSCPDERRSRSRALASRVVRCS